MTIIYLMRHGETDWNHEGRIQGAHDVPMNQLGIKQTKNVASYFEKNVRMPCLLISSDAKRCRAASEILTKTLKIPINTQKELREVDFGIWNKRKISELKKNEKLREAWNKLIPDHEWEDGESLANAHKRAYGCIQNYVNHAGNNNLVVVTHGVIIQLLISFWLTGSLQYSSRFTISNGSLTIMRFTDEKEVRAVAINVIP